MKFSHALAALAIITMCGCKAGTPNKAENAIGNEINWKPACSVLISVCTPGWAYKTEMYSR